MYINIGSMKVQLERALPVPSGRINRRIPVFSKGYSIFKFKTNGDRHISMISVIFLKLTKEPFDIKCCMALKCVSIPLSLFGEFSGIRYRRLPLRWLEIVFEIFFTRKRFTFIYVITAFMVAT